jgi:hypothetical protein
MIRRNGNSEAPREMTLRGLAVRCLKVGPLVAALALGLALAGCDKCGDFFWQHGSCKSGPPPN